MSHETLEIVTSRKVEEAQLQLALQCAPLIAGLKFANLLNIPKSYFGTVRRMIAGSDISWYILLGSGDRMMVLLYHKESLKRYLAHDEVRQIMEKLGYHSMELSNVLKKFCGRYESYMEHKECFPHEMGLLLGYPVEDVAGFIKHKGENSLYAGYWKVYENKDRKLRLFKSYENAKESMIKRLSCGISMVDIIRTCTNNWENNFIFGNTN